MNHLKLWTVEARQDMTVDMNNIYYAPLYYHLALKDRTFALVLRTEGEQNNAIDVFLLSLAKNETSKKSVAIILSGVGKDRTKGAEALKKPVGLVIAQFPESCVFPSMPLYIIKKGLAD